MFCIVDLIIVAIILLFTILGYKRGLVKLALNLLTFFIAIVVAYLIYKPVAGIVIDNTDIDESIQTTIESKILPDGVEKDEKIDVENLSSSLPTVILKNSSNTIQSIAESISHTLIETLCFIIIFVAVKVVLKFITIIADLIAKLPILKQFNELGGTIYGLLEGFFIVFLLLAVVSLTAPLWDTSILYSIDNSIIGSYLYNNNILLDFIM